MSRTRRLAGRAMAFGNRFLDPVLSRPEVTRLLGVQPIRVRYTGRRSGRAFELPAWAKPTAGGVLITVGMPGQKTWWRNFRTARPLEISVARGPWRAGTGLVREPRPGHVAVDVTWA